MNEISESQGAKAKLVVVDPELEGQRIDNFLLNQLKGVPRSHVYRLLRTGQVRVNSGRIQAQYRLKGGDLVRLPPVRRSEPQQHQPQIWLHEKLEARILFEDDALIILNKPSGFAVHGGTGLMGGVIEVLREIRPESRHLELVHRIDKDTSGCLLISKRRSALRVLHEQFRGEGVNKVYLALLNGAWNRKQWQVDAPLQKNILQSGERMVKVNPAGKVAVTDFCRVRQWEHATLVEASPITGRTHQIRVHAQHMGFPLLGDERYGLADANRRMKNLGLKRMFLHAKSLEFKHPLTGKVVSIEAPLDADLADFMKLLGD